MSAIFSSPNALVYVRRSGLIVAGKHIKPTRLTFPAKLVENMEVLNADGFIDTCQQFFEAQGLSGQRVLVVLDQEIVFEKAIPFDKTGKPSALTDAFVDAIPLEVGKRAYVSYINDNSLHIYATNFDLYDMISQALEAANVAKLIAITPVSAYGLEPGQQLSAVVSKLIRDTVIRKQVDFSHSSPM